MPCSSVQTSTSTTGFRSMVSASHGRRRDGGGGGEFHFQSPSRLITCPRSFSTLLDIQEWKSRAFPIFASSSVSISSNFRLRLGVCVRLLRRFRWSNSVPSHVKSHNTTLATRHFNVHFRRGGSIVLVNKFPMFSAPSTWNMF